MRYRFFNMILFLFLTHLHTALDAAELAGRVVDAKGLGLESATIELVGSGRGGLSDRDGRFVLGDLEPQRYLLRVSHLGYVAVLDSIDLRAASRIERHIVLRGMLYEMEGVQVMGTLTSAQARALNDQHRAPNIKHVSSSELFSRFPDRNAGETLQRMPGVALDRDQGEGEFVQVRGLNAQLNAVAVNGKRIPAPSASIEEGRAVGLDLLQLHHAERIEITKALTPDMDADALGGAVNMVLKSAPEHPEYELSVSGGINGEPAPLRSWGREMGEVSGSLARRFAGGRLGALLGGSLYRTNRAALLHQAGYAADGHPSYARWDNYDVLRQRAGLLAALDYQVHRNHDLRFSYTYNAFNDDEIRRRRHFSFADGQEDMEVRNRLEEQRFYLAELRSEHRVADYVLHLSLAQSRAGEELPDRTYFLFRRSNDFGGLDARQRLSLDVEHAFDGLGDFPLVRVRFDNESFAERDRVLQADLERPFQWGHRQGAWKVGAKLWRKDKSASQRRWQRFPEEGTAALEENAFDFVDVHYDDARALALLPLRGYRPVQQLLNYDARETVYAAYAQQTLQWTRRLSLLWGMRYEETRHVYGHRASFVRSRAQYANVLPSLHVTYRTGERSTLRLALTSGLSRPEYTRLLPITTPPSDGLILQGNPDLKATRAQGVDLLFETFPGALGLVSVGAFFKRIADPVVTYAEDRTPFVLLTPVNGESGRLWGAEWALVHYLKRYELPALENVGLYVNYAFSQARIDYGSVRSDRGPLPGHARHTGNVGLLYDHGRAGRAWTLSAAYRAPMLKDLGDSQREDVWYESEWHVDFSARQRLFGDVEIVVKINNLSDAREREVYGSPYGRKATRWREREVYGRSGQLGLHWSL